VRLFFAIELQTPVLEGLGRLGAVEDLDYRWVDARQLHVTLAFLGEQPESALPLLERVGATAAASSPRLKLKLGEPGSFGPRRAPRVLWIGLDGDVPGLLALQSRLDAGLRAAGFALEDREFRPHVTLARRRPNASSAPLAWPPRTIQRSAFEVHHLTLFQSRLSPRGATYVVLKAFPLAADA
jgi:2'-5' RNA ligase